MWWSRTIAERFRGIEREIDFRWKVTEAEIDRRVRGHEIAAAEAEQQLSGRMDTMAARLEALINANGVRLDRVEAVQDRQRGRQGAYAGIAAVAGVLLTLFIIIAGHIHVS